jgi:hypothetical protein
VDRPTHTIPKSEDISSNKSESNIPFGSGLVVPWTYFGSRGACFLLHLEDGNLASAILHIVGAPKVWIVLTEVQYTRFHAKHDSTCIVDLSGPLS